MKIALAKYTKGAGYVVCTVFVENDEEKWSSSGAAERMRLCSVVTNPLGWPTLAGWFGLDRKVFDSWPDDEKIRRSAEYLDTKVGTTTVTDPGYCWHAKGSTNLATPVEAIKTNPYTPEGSDPSEGIVWESK